MEPDRDGWLLAFVNAKNEDFATLNTNGSVDAVRASGALDALWDIPHGDPHSSYIRRFMDNAFSGRLWDEGVPYMRPRRFPNQWARILLYTYPMLQDLNTIITVEALRNANYALLLLHNYNGLPPYRETLYKAIVSRHITLEMMQFLLNIGSDMLLIMGVPVTRYAHSDVYDAVQRVVTLYIAQHSGTNLDDLLCQRLMHLLEDDPNAGLRLILHGAYFPDFMGNTQVWVNAWKENPKWCVNYWIAKYNTGHFNFPELFLQELFSRLDIFTLDSMEEVWTYVATRLRYFSEDDPRSLSHLDACMRFAGNPSLLRLMFSRDAFENSRLVDTMRPHILRLMGYANDAEVRDAMETGVRRPERLRWLLSENP